MAPAEPPGQLALPASGQAEGLSGALVPSLLGLSVGSKLTSAELAKLWSKFEADYPSEIIEVHNRPCKQLIQLVNQQKQQEDFRFIPWKQLLTEAQCDKLKLGAQKKEKSFLGCCLKPRVSGT